MFKSNFELPTFDPGKLTQTIRVSDELLELENEEDVEFESNPGEGDCLFICHSDTALSDLLYITKVVYDGEVAFALRFNHTGSVLGVITPTARQALEEGRKLTRQKDLTELLDSMRPNIQEIAGNLAKKISDPANFDNGVFTVKPVTPENKEIWRKETEDYEREKREHAIKLNERRYKLLRKKPATHKTSNLSKTGPLIFGLLILAAIAWVNWVGYNRYLPLSRFGKALCFICKADGE